MVVQENADLSKLNTFGFSVCAQYFCEIESQDDLLTAIAFAKQNSLPVLVIGEGSNLILREYIPAVVIRQTSQEFKILEEDSQSVVIEIDAGHSWHQLVEKTVNLGWSGLENLALIPGSVGAAPVQNIGAYGVELKDRFVSLTAYDQRQEKFVDLSLEDCNFSYRDSLFKQEPNRYVIVNVRLFLSKCFLPQIKYGELSEYLANKTVSVVTVFDAVIAIRQAKLPNPKLLGNVGSFFKNPIVTMQKYEALWAEFPSLVVYTSKDDCMKLSAGWLIEQAGWKGYRQGEVGVYHKQALILVNYSQGTARDIMTLAADIQQSVFEKYGVSLCLEPYLYPEE